LTSKTVTAKLTAFFEGDYIPKEDVDDYLIDWVGSGLEDRDDLVGWTLEFESIEEFPLEGETE
jgi:hypothetical protein